jgi:hypothetical protein
MENPKSPAQNPDRESFENKYLENLAEDYSKIIGKYSAEKRKDKEELVTNSFQSLRSKLQAEKDSKFGPREEAILKLKLARYAQLNDEIDNNALFDAIVESPTFITNDKGSFQRLFEVHEEKTVQRIAEKRKRLADIKGNESLNPYEALFTTTSGNYYMARLLNMPHLKEESAYMDHCVGRSESYINKIKKGEIEILSFRTVPKINHETNKLEGDRPLMTIEYDLKNKTIKQMKGPGDSYLSKNNKYYEDMVDALRRLRTTETDTGKLHEFVKISPSELTKIVVSENHVLTDRGEISINDIRPEENPLVIKFGRLVKVSNEDAVKVLRLANNITCSPDEVAQTPEEVNDKTKIYVGPLFPGVFQFSFEHIFLSLPDKEVFREDIKIGGKTKDQLLTLLDQAKINVHDYTKRFLGEFTTKEAAEDITLVRLTVAELGLGRTVNIDQIYKRAEDLGLELCPAEVGLHYRLKYQDQPEDEQLNIAMRQIGPSQDPNILMVEQRFEGSFLSLTSGKSDTLWTSNSTFLFRTRPNGKEQIANGE